MKKVIGWFFHFFFIYKLIFSLTLDYTKPKDTNCKPMVIKWFSYKVDVGKTTEITYVKDDVYVSIYSTPYSGIQSVAKVGKNEEKLENLCLPDFQWNRDGSWSLTFSYKIDKSKLAECDSYIEVVSFWSFALLI